MRFLLESSDVFYVGKTEVIKNPTDKEYTQLYKEIRKSLGSKYDYATYEPLIRRTFDEQGNEYIWNALDSTHYSVEKAIRRKYNVRVNQNRMFDLDESFKQTTYHLYHGAREPFNLFNYEYIGAHGLENGFGIYFTNDLQIAQSYGDYVYEADIIIHRLFSTTEITITKEQVKQYISKYIDKNGGDFLSSYGDVGYLGYNKLLDIAVDELFSYNQSDNDILSEILPEIKNKWTDEAYDGVYEIFGKDGIKYTGYSDWDGKEVTNYIVYSNNQIKNKKLYNNKD